MSFAQLVRLRLKKLAGIFMLLFLFSFGLRTAQDILTQINPIENNSPNQQEFKKDSSRLIQFNFSDNDQDVIHHHSLILYPSYFIILNFFFFSFNIYNERQKTTTKVCLYKPLKGLFISNRALLI